MSLLTWLYGDSENAQRAADADAKHRELNRARYGEDYVMVQDRISGQPGVDVWVPPDQQDKQVGAAFDEGWQDGKKNITAAVSGGFKVVSDGLSSVLLGVPAWVWLALLAGAWVWLGMPGLSKLKAKRA